MEKGSLVIYIYTYICTQYTTVCFNYHMLKWMWLPFESFVCGTILKRKGLFADLRCCMWTLPFYRSVAALVFEVLQKALLLTVITREQLHIITPHPTESVVSIYLYSIVTTWPGIRASNGGIYITHLTSPGVITADLISSQLNAPRLVAAMTNRAVQCEPSPTQFVMAVTSHSALGLIEIRRVIGTLHNARVMAGIFCCYVW